MEFDVIGSYIGGFIGGVVGAVAMEYYEQNYPNSFEIFKQNIQPPRVIINYVISGIFSSALSGIIAGTLRNYFS